MEEKWLPIKDYEEKYEVSNTGKIRSLKYNNTNQIRELKPKINKQGYLEVKLSKNNKTKDFMVSRLVVETFTNLKLTKNDIVMYKDKEITNNSLDNLYLITRGKRQEITYDNDKRKRHKFEYYGKKLPIKEISQLNGIDENTIRNRLTKLYWNIYEAGEIPVGKPKRKEKVNV